MFDRLRLVGVISTAAAILANTPLLVASLFIDPHPRRGYIMGAASIIMCCIAFLALRPTRADIKHARGAWVDHRRLILLQRRWDNATDALARAETATKIGDRILSEAVHLEASWLARATTFLPTPAALRAEAAIWWQRADEAARPARVHGWRGGGKSTHLHALLREKLDAGGQFEVVDGKSTATGDEPPSRPEGR
jgi:hypothetical protein